MKLIWKITACEVRRLQDFMVQAELDPFVRARVHRNLAHRKPKVSPAGFWHALVGALLTTQQKSGPDSAVARFMAARPFSIALPLCRSKRDPGKFVTRTLVAFGGIRRSTQIGVELSTNLRALEDGMWVDLLGRINGLRREVLPADESAVAAFLDENFVGLGPKQSRNLLQGLGLTKYEIPIDSRLTKWLNEFGFPFRLSSTGLADREYYGVVSQGVQHLCAAAEVVPCVFDAAVFSSYDHGGWQAGNIEHWGYGGV